MGIENLDGVSGVDRINLELRAAFVKTQLSSERQVSQAVAEEDPQKRREMFEAILEGFKGQRMSDPLVSKPMILDAYGVFDDFALEVTKGVSIYGVQNIIERMENPSMVGDMLTKPRYGSEDGMYHWPGFSTYEWARGTSWEDFEKAHVGRDKAGFPELLRVNPDLVGGRHIYSRLWFSYATLRSEYYNPDLNLQFDQTFPGWRNASLILDAALLDRPNREDSVERIALRGHYIQEILPLMKNEAKREDLRSLVAANPQILKGLSS